VMIMLANRTYLADPLPSRSANLIHASLPCFSYSIHQPCFLGTAVFTLQSLWQTFSTTCQAQHTWGLASCPFAPHSTMPQANDSALPPQPLLTCVAAAPTGEPGPPRCTGDT
jgi:hypothetical protein